MSAGNGNLDRLLLILGLGTLAGMAGERIYRQWVGHHPSLGVPSTHSTFQSVGQMFRVSLEDAKRAKVSA